MKCPRCIQAVSPGEDCCLHCGFSLDVTDEQFGDDTVILQRLTDAAGELREEERAEIETVLDSFERRFPQLFLAVYCGALPAQTSLRQFGFWLLNRAAVASVEVTRPNERGLLLVIDVHGRSCALIPGYYVECYLSEADGTAVLHGAKRELVRGRYGEAVKVIVARLSRRLRLRATEAAANPRKFTPATPSRVPAPPKFIRIREGPTDRKAGSSAASSESKSKRRGAGRSRRSSQS